MPNVLLPYYCGKGWRLFLTQENYTDLRVKHLEMVQAVIARLAVTGEAHKNYCLTISTAICGLAVTLQKPMIVLLALLPIVVFAFLDAQYLRTERRFRDHFDLVRAEDWGLAPNFSMCPKSKPSYLSALTSWSIAGFYGGLALGVIFVTFLVGL
jgi:uncharacterized protein (DUF486 family)